MNNRKGIIFFLSISVILFSLSAINPAVDVYAEGTTNPVDWIFCGLTPADRAIYKFMTTDEKYYRINGKSAIGQEENKLFTPLNSILEFTGFDFSENQTGDRNPFDVFGVSGLRFTSYKGEWKYYNVNPCTIGGRTIPQSTNFGQFYPTRKEPLSTYSETSVSKDIRTQQFNQGFFSALWKSMTDRVSNGLLSVAKFFVSLMIALVSLSYMDFTELVGLTSSSVSSVAKTLYENLFIPFFFLALAVMSGYYIYKGLIKREYREALLSGLGKMILCYGLAFYIGLNPEVVNIPNRITTVAQIAILRISGRQISKTEETTLCSSSIGLDDMTLENLTDKDYLEKAGKTLRSVVACKLWSEFLFRPWVWGQFGARYEDLSDLPNINKEWVGSPIVKLGDKEVENLALFHLSVMSGKHKPIDGLQSARVGSVNRDYYRIVDTLANYEEVFYEYEEDGETLKKITDGGNPTKIKYRDGYPEVKETEPLIYWDYWTGNRKGNRFAYATIVLLFSTLGSIVPILLGLTNLSLSIGLSLLSMLAPIFLLFGAATGRLGQLFNQYVGTIISTMIKRLVVSFLFLLSITMTGAGMNMVNEVGYIQAILFTFIITIVLFKNRKALLDEIAQVNLSRLNLQSALSGFNKAKEGGKTSGLVVASGIVGGVAAKQAGGDFFSGARAGAGQFLRNRAYRSQVGRVANIVYDTTTKRGDSNDSKFCCSCGVKIREDEYVWVDDYGNYFCEPCAASNSYEGLTEILMDNEEDNTIDVTKESGIELTINGESDKYYHPTYKSFQMIDDKDLWGSEGREKTKEEIKNSLLITNIDIQKAIKEGKKLKTGYIPEPIRPYIDPYDVYKAIQSDNLDEYTELIQAGYEKYFTEVSTLNNDTGDTIEKGIEEIKRRLKEDFEKAVK